MSDCVWVFVEREGSKMMVRREEKVKCKGRGSPDVCLDQLTCDAGCDGGEKSKVRTNTWERKTEYVSRLN